MKNLILIIGIIIGTIMLVLTIVGVIGNSSNLYSNSSAAYLTHTSQINIYCSIMFLTMFTFGLYLYRKRRKILAKFILLFSFVFWVFSGRTIAFSYFPNGEVISGYYYLKFNEFEISTNNQDYEKTISIDSEVTILPVWRLNIKNENVDETIFLGPFVWDSASNILKDKVGKYHNVNNKSL